MTPLEGGLCTPCHLVPNFLQGSQGESLPIQSTNLGGRGIPQAIHPIFALQQLFLFISSVGPCKSAVSGPRTGRFYRKNDSSLRLCGSVTTTAECFSVGYEYRKERLQDLFISHFFLYRSTCLYLRVPDRQSDFFNDTCCRLHPYVSFFAVGTVKMLMCSSHIACFCFSFSSWLCVSSSDRNAPFYYTMR